MNSVLTVSQLNRYIAFRFKEDSNLKGKLIRGEISNFTFHTKSGHFYFTLKDRESSIKAVMFNNFAGALRFRPENGMDVIVMASVQVYERDGVYQLYVTDMQPSGVGALYLAFEQLKEKLSAEGLFAPELKKSIPPYPKKIGIISALTGAALQDILNILSRRYPVAEALVIPAVVQGENAPHSICEALELAQTTDCDVLILARGGGSLEDLAAFNTEAVARAIFTCSIPLISAVGHETDVTIADFAADLRAPTPSAGAELAAPDRDNIIRYFENLQKLLYERTLKILESKQQRLSQAAAKFSALSMEQKLTVSELQLKNDTDRLHKAIAAMILNREASLNRLTAKLDALDPFKVMGRGYALVFHEDKLVHSSDEVQTGDLLRIRLNQGEVSAAIQLILK